jgi:hypothetical protein
MSEQIESEINETEEQRAKKRPGPKPGWMEDLIAAKAAAAINSLFLVEGTVQFRPTAAGESSRQSNQLRIVCANNFEEAMDKYKKYFTSLNSTNGTYTVINITCSQSIS